MNHLHHYLIKFNPFQRLKIYNYVLSTLNKMKNVLSIKQYIIYLVDSIFI